MKRIPHARLKPLSLHPLTFEQALSAFMQVNPEKVAASMKVHRSASRKDREKRKTVK